MALNLKKTGIRALSGIVYVALIVLCILGKQLTIACLTAILGLWACMEFLSMANRDMPIKIIPTTIDMAALIALIAFPYGCPIWVWILLMLVRLSLVVYDRSETPLRNVSVSLATQIYIGLPMLTMVLTGKEFPNYILLVFILLWINDTGAFLVGSLTGKHKFIERVSPNKTWEGFIGGVALTLLSTAVFWLCCKNFFNFPYNHDIAIWLCLGIVVSCMGTMGDLFESRIKRSLKVKDSGHTIPGHGGILDRIDSFLFAMPSAYILLMMMLDF